MARRGRQRTVLTSKKKCGGHQHRFALPEHDNLSQVRSHRRQVGGVEAEEPQLFLMRHERSGVFLPLRIVSTKMKQRESLVLRISNFEDAAGDSFMSLGNPIWKKTRMQQR